MTRSLVAPKLFGASLFGASLFGALLFGAALAAGPLQAQTSAIPTAAEEVLVRVDVSDMSGTLAEALEVAPDRVPRSVEVTLPVAAAVCDVTAEQLMQVRSVEQHIECKAITVSDELTAATKEQLAE